MMSCFRSTEPYQPGKYVSVLGRGKFLGVGAYFVVHWLGSYLVLGRSSIIIDNQTFTSLILINQLQNWQSIIIGKR